MLGIHDFWLFVAAGLLLNVTPGPDFAYVVARSAQLGWRGGAVAALAIGAGCFVHITAAALGLSALIAASAVAFSVVKWIGAAYLVYVGVTMLFTSAHKAPPHEAPGGRASHADATPLSNVFWRGFLTNALNPKVALFFLAFLPQFIDADAPMKPLAFAALGLLFDLTGTVWNLAAAWFTARVAATRPYARIGRWLERAIGAMFIALGVRIALAQRL
jgi:RhtB (resistance to homoserine/threonine) family protein